MDSYNTDLLDDSNQIDIRSLNRTFRNLLLNDNANIVTGNNIPGLWEQRWYNDRNNTDLYYKKGDAVWINTENIDDVIRKRQSDLYAYSSGNALLRKQLDKFLEDEDMSSYFTLLREFAIGKTDKLKGMIFWLGDLTENAQVRISKIDNNIEYPDNDDAWEDFIWNKTDEEISLSVYNLHNTLQNNTLSSHLKQYHLYDTDIKVNTLSNTYLLNDFSNIDGKQSFKSHYWYENNIQGFDHIKIFQSKKTGNGLVRWYRLWDSGYLEHGGIIDINNPMNGDKYNQQAYTYTVNLYWNQSNGQKSIIYDYPSQGLIQFYNREQKYKSGYSEVMIPESYIGNTYRYNVSITPICDNIKPYSNLSYNIYDAIDVCFMNNTDFSFVVPNLNCTKFIYSVKGYTMKGTNI